MWGLLIPVAAFFGLWVGRSAPAQAGTGNLASIGREIFGPFLPANMWSAGKVRDTAAQFSASFPDVDTRMVAAIAYVESKFKPKAYRYEPHLDDASYGLMQTLTKTAQWMWDLGYRAFPRPTGEDLYDGKKSIYFGMAYLQYLANYKKKKRGERFVVESYNGGPGNTSRYTAQYWAKYEAAKEMVA